MTDITRYHQSIPTHLLEPKTLRAKQSLFAFLLPLLIRRMFDMGYEVTMGDVYATTGHMKASLHGERLAGDLNLFKDGVYLTDSKAHEPFGQYWESLHPLCRWGGRFKSPDGNHYSITHGGKA